MEAHSIDSTGNGSTTLRAPNVDYRTIEELEPERAKAMRAEAKQRAEAENPPEPAVAEAAPPPEPEPKPKKEKAAVAAAAPGAAPTQAASSKPSRDDEAAAAPPPAAQPPASPEAAVSLSSSPPPPRDKPLPGWVPYVGAGLTVALTAGAIATGLSASSRFDDLRATCGQTAAGCTADQIDGVRSRDRLATILWIAAGMFASATGVAIFVNAREAGASAQVRF
jgi:hypothetical protein